MLYLKKIQVGAQNLMCSHLKKIKDNPATEVRSVETKESPQTTYAESLLRWNALLLALLEEKKPKPYNDILKLLDETKEKTFLFSTKQLGLKREEARIKNQYISIARLPEKSASHETGEEETEQQNSSKKSKSLNALNLDNARNILVETNWMRLYLLRINRLFSAISMVAHNAKFNEILKSANSVLHPIFNILSWAYYLPRLTINLAMLVKHTVPNRWMDEKEKQLSFRKRLKAQWDRRWSELLNDGVWCAVGITTCFVLTGPHAMLLIVALYVFDVINISAKAYLDIRRYNKVIKKTEIEINDLKSENEVEAKKKSIKTLQTLKKQQCISSALNAGTAVGLLTGMILFIPALAVCPVIPVLGASIVLTTCITYIFLKKAFIQTPEALVQEKWHDFFAKKEAAQRGELTPPNNADALDTSQPTKEYTKRNELTAHA